MGRKLTNKEIIALKEQISYHEKIVNGDSLFRDAFKPHLSKMHDELDHMRKSLALGCIA